MKSYILKPVTGVFAILALVFSFSGCNLFDKADDIKFDTELEVVWEADENGEATDFAYSKTAVVKFEDNSEIQKYIDKIKDVKISKITYRVTDYAQDDGQKVFFKNGIASFTPVGSSTSAGSVAFTASASGVDLQTTTTDTELPVNDGTLNDIAAVFKQDKQVNMTAAGVLSLTPVEFKVVSVFHVTITAEVLD